MKRDYRKAIGWLLALILALPFAVATVEGQTTQQQPSAKVTAKTSQFTLIPPTTSTGGWVTILSNNIKTAEMKDLFVTAALDRKSTRLNSSHVEISYAVFCLKKKKPAARCEPRIS